MAGVAARPLLAAVLALSSSLVSPAAEPVVGFMKPLQRRAHTARRASTEEDVEVEGENLTREEDGSVRLGSSKLIYDPNKGRFYEKEVEEICREEFCARDEKTGEPILLTVKEKERIFLDCIQSYYYSGRQILTDDDFNKLKEDLIWEGSKVAILNRNETLFLSAMSAYLKGQPILSDAEFDELKRGLKETQSPIAVSTEPRCYVDTGICTVTFQEDKWRKGILYVPGVLMTLTLWLVLSYELLEPLRYVNPIISIGLGSPLVYYASRYLTENVFFNDPLIAYGPCPACSAPNRIYFGDILSVEGPKETAEITCRTCGAEATVTRATLRAVTFPKTEGEDAGAPAGKKAAPKKKAAVSADDDE